MKLVTRNELFSIPLIVAALGYFVDVYDLILFSVVRVKSLKDLGLSDAELLTTGVFLLNTQMIGMLIGGILWGIIGDKCGRVKVLFGSILIYSVANLLNAFIQDPTQYAVLRFIAGVGLAGEIGAGMTLVSELLPQRLRGYGTTIVATFGVLGGVVAGLVAEFTDWRIAYIFGGVMGFVLLFLRVAVHESSLFESSKKEHGSFGDLRILLYKPKKLFRYLTIILVGLPTWYIVGICATFAPEIAKGLGATELPLTSYVVTLCYVGLVLGDIGSGILSQLIKSRKKVMACMLLLGIFVVYQFLTQKAPALSDLYWWYVALGVVAGIWVLTLTIAAEHFGTNIRATVATTVPNFIRGAAVPITLCFRELIPTIGVVQSALVVGAVVYSLAAVALLFLDETYEREMNFIEN